MKKYFIASLLSLFVVSGFAQFNFGIKAGYNSSLGLKNLGSVSSGSYNLNSVKSELSNGFQAGVFARIGFNKMYFQPEFLYNMGKKEYTMTLQDAQNHNLQFDKRVNVSTLEVPLLLGYKLLDFKLVNLRAFAGPKLCFNAGSSLDYSNLTSGGGVTQDQLIKDIKAAQLGLEAGVGIDVFMFTLDARYNLIKDMYQTKISDLNIDNIQGNTFVISLGWKLF
jgi:hypothetical protein